MTEAQFLNVDVELFGTFDRRSLVAALGDAVFVLHEGGVPAEPALAFELSTANPTFPAAISELVALVRALPVEARREWDSAARRVFNIGVQAGHGESRGEWTLGTELLAALAGVGAEVTLTVYGAPASAPP